MVARFLTHYFLPLSFGILLLACGQMPPPQPPPSSAVQREPELEPSFQPNETTRESVGNIHFDRHLSNSEYALVAKDIHALRSMSFSAASSTEVLRVMTDLHQVSAHSLMRWLEERVQYILNPYFAAPQWNRGDAPIADNFGAGAYLIAKKVNEENQRRSPERRYRYASTPHFGMVHIPLAQARVEGIGIISITSPRTGIIRLGEPYFSTYRNAGLPISGNIFRLSVLFHEARHSDGHGPSLAFSHALCPPGHMYAGKPSCDENSNGPNTVGSLVLKAALDSCTQCSTSGKEYLRLVLADLLIRTVGQNPPTLDPTPEGTR